METNKYSKSVIQQAYNTASNKHSTTEQQNAALHILAACHLLTEAVLDDARRARHQRWIDQCSFIIRQKERELSAEWSDSRLHHKTEADLHEWITGKIVGVVRDETLIVTLGGQSIPLMKKDHAASLSFESFDGKFRLRYAADLNAMVIDQLVPNSKTSRKIKTSSPQLQS